jgi:hypothetical protein
MRPRGAHLLDTRDRVAVEALRLADLRDAGTFIATPSAVAWSDSDASSRVIGIYGHPHGGRGAPLAPLLATMRAELLARPGDLPPKLDYDSLHEVVPLPCGLLGKAVTRKDYQGLGLNTYLQFLAYHHFHELGVRHVVGTIMTNAPYVAQLRRLGYEFILNPEGWRRYGYDSRGPTYVVHLNLRRRYDQVMADLLPRVAHLLKEYPPSADLSAARAEASLVG